MAFKTFAPGVLTSSDVNTFLMRQAVITCTSSTRPGSPNEGMTIYETDTDSYALYDGSNWVYQGRVQTYTPTMTEWTLGNGTLTGAYVQVGKLVHGRVSLTFGSTTTASGTAGLGPLFSAPVTVNATVDLGHEFGLGRIFDFSAGATFPIAVRRGTGGLFQPSLLSKATVGTDFVTSDNTMSSTVPFTWATSDFIRFTFTYMAA
jgi:hypothetical protein